MRSRMTYLRSPFPNIPPPPSFAPRSRRQLPPVRIPHRVPEPPLAGAHLYVPVLRKPGEHLVGLGHAERGLESSPRGRELPVPRERHQELLLLAPLVNRLLRPRLEETRHTPRREPDRRYQEEGDHPEEKEEREEVERPSHREEEQPPNYKTCHQYHRRTMAARMPRHPTSPAQVAHPARTVHLASVPHSSELALQQYITIYRDITKNLLTRLIISSTVTGYGCSPTLWRYLRGSGVLVSRISARYALGAPLLSTLRPAAYACQHFSFLCRSPHARSRFARRLPGRSFDERRAARSRSLLADYTDSRNGRSRQEVERDCASENKKAEMLTSEGPGPSVLTSLRRRRAEMRALQKAHSFCNAPQV